MNMLLNMLLTNLKKVFKTRYRIVSDNYCGYSVEAWRWYFPLWIDIGSTYGSEIGAAKAAERHKNGNLVKHLGTLEW